MQGFRPVTLAHEGATLVGQLIAPSASGRHPAVLVMASAMGLGPHYREIARRVADQGYVALATDMCGDGAYFSAPADAGPTHAKLVGNPELVRSRSLAWFDAVRRQPEVDPDRIAALGYCFGGQCVLDIARSGADIKAVVSFHGTLRTDKPAAPGAIRGLVAAYTGALDPFAPLQDVEAFEEEMRRAKARLHMTVFSDVYHSFTTVEDGALPIEGLAYDPLADAVSWAGTLATLKQVLADHP